MPKTKQSLMKTVVVVPKERCAVNFRQINNDSSLSDGQTIFMHFIDSLHHNRKESRSTPTDSCANVSYRSQLLQVTCGSSLHYMILRYTLQHLYCTSYVVMS